MKISEVNRSKLTPMMRQYLSIKDEHPDLIIMFRLGDFYEVFFEDAVKVSRDLELTFRRTCPNVWSPTSCCQCLYRKISG